MKDNSNLKKDRQLQMSHGKASNILRKKILFSLIQRLEEDTCYRCGEKIETVENLSIEHKIDWLDSSDPVGLFFDLENISFSHLICNVSNSRKAKGTRESTPHGTGTRYSKGCRCDECLEYAHKKNTSDTYRKTNREYQKKRYHTDPVFRQKNIDKSKKEITS